jgi:sulfoxide reductase heme-binding subunit YedZ
LALLPLLWTARLVYGAPVIRTPLVFVEGAPQQALLFTGKTALICLVLSLCCTPAARIFGWRQAVTVRKSLGLWGFGFALFHGLFFLGGKEILYTLHAWQDVGALISPALFLGLTKTPYARWGAMALTLLIPLALTSHRFAMRWLGKSWKRLHRLVYLAVPLALLHYWQREAFLEQVYNAAERPDYRQPALFVLLVAVLLLVRIPVVHRQLRAVGRRVAFVPQSHVE